MRVLITGANGLVGNRLVKKLQQDNTNEIFTISSQLSGENNFNIDFKGEWNTQQLPLDIDSVIHLAQSPSFRDFPEKAKEVFYTNTLSTLKIVDWAQKNGIKKFVYASSAGIYGTSDNAFEEETDIIYKKELGFYLGTKYCSEIILDNYNTLLNLVQLRFFFVYGKEQNKSMLIPRLVENIKAGNPIQLAGQSGIKINPIYVGDAVDAIIQAIDFEGSEKFNIAGPEVLSLKEICEFIGDALNIKPIFLQNNTKAGHVFGSIDKMSSLLHTPTIRFKEAIKEFV